MIGVQLKELRAADFDIRHTFESAQPLTFYADYDYLDRVLTYPSNVGMITAVFSRSSSNCRIAVHNSGAQMQRRKSCAGFALETT